MKIKYYIDTCIWRDYYENRSDKFRPLGEWALFLLNKIKANNEEIIVSDFLIYELSLFLTKEDMRKLFEPYEKNIIMIESSTEHNRLAREYSLKYSLPKPDALHLVLALEQNAVLVTRDFHFLNASDLIVIRKPEDLI